MTVKIPVYLVEPNGEKGFYEKFRGTLKTGIEFSTFASSVETKNQVLVFKPIK